MVDEREISQLTRRKMVVKKAAEANKNTSYPSTENRRNQMIISSVSHHLIHLLITSLSFTISLSFNLKISSKPAVTIMSLHHWNEKRKCFRKWMRWDVRDKGGGASDPKWQRYEMVDDGRWDGRLWWDRWW